MTAFWMNGTVCAEEQAKVSVLDHGLLYGDGVFEGIRCVQGRVLDLGLHLARLEVSARAIQLKVPSRTELERAVIETLTALGAKDAYVRLVVTRGQGSLGVDVQSCLQPLLFCIAGELNAYAASGDGIRLATTSLRRPPFDVLDPRVKSLNYLNNVLAKMEAKRHGADEALVLNHRATIAEASVANVFACIDEVVMTPPASDGALAGITRGRALRLLASAGRVVREASLTRVDLLQASEVFLTGTGIGVVAVASLDGETLGSSRDVSGQLVSLTRTYAATTGQPIPALLSESSERRLEPSTAELA